MQLFQETVVAGLLSKSAYHILTIMSYSCRVKIDHRPISGFIIKKIKHLSKAGGDIYVV